MELRNRSLLEVGISDSELHASKQLSNRTWLGPGWVSAIDMDDPTSRVGSIQPRSTTELERVALPRIINDGREAKARRKARLAREVRARRLEQEALERGFVGHGRERAYLERERAHSGGGTGKEKALPHQGSRTTFQVGEVVLASVRQERDGVGASGAAGDDGEYSSQAPTG